MCSGDYITARGGYLLAFALGFHIPTIQTQEDNLAERVFEKAHVKLIRKVSLADSKVGWPKCAIEISGDCWNHFEHMRRNFHYT